MATKKLSFAAHTDRFVAIRTYTCGTTQLGYGKTRNAALSDCAAFMPLSSVAVVTRTDETVLVGRGRYKTTEYVYA